MMQIDRLNYEVWFIDWLDGNLNSLQVEQLMLFLDQNPELREEFVDLSPLSMEPSGISFRHKEDLKKTPSDISNYQFDYLCAAYLENDLTKSQQTELEEIVNADPGKKKRFDQIQKTILTPASISYKYKHLLLKRTTAQKIIRLSVIGLSAAAAISLIIFIYSVLPETPSSKLNNSAHNMVSDSTFQRPYSVVAEDRVIRDSIPAAVQKKIINKSVTGHKEDNIITSVNIKMAISVDSMARKNDNQEIAIIKVPVYLQVDLRNEITTAQLIESKLTITIPDSEDERGQVSKFISRTFREKFLKEETPHDTPLKGFEIAEAGVAGLNKLFGWQMALDMKNDDNGQPKSVYFSSKILKVNAPVKKRDAKP